MTLGRYGQPIGDPPERNQRERGLMYSYRGTSGADMPRSLVEPCACGLDIISPSSSGVDIFRAVSEHNHSRQHLIYRALLQPSPTADEDQPVDLSGLSDGSSGSAGEAA